MSSLKLTLGSDIVHFFVYIDVPVARSTKPNGILFFMLTFDLLSEFEFRMDIGAHARHVSGSPNL